MTSSKSLKNHAACTSANTTTRDGRANLSVSLPLLRTHFDYAGGIPQILKWKLAVRTALLYVQFE
mgnify:CR=1 FL=1